MLRANLGWSGTEFPWALATQSRGLQVSMASLFISFPSVLFYTKMGFDQGQNQASDFSFSKKSQIKVFKNVSLGRATAR